MGGGKLCARGRGGSGGGGGGGIGVAPYKKMGVKKQKTKQKKYSMQEVMRGVGTGGPEGPSRRPKATNHRVI